ncbi:hypothetical protein GP486_005018 [Trichoglossum hirsutum]|uniref:Uncharacterized protein n=1 Tax=Trichoglossum hirsutum TaxID=265104 RepID=A0A9P8L9W8_9PEZI|nr:hypothetical protein GP486_005018 [Trichoglossum hirsutum]
MFYISKFESPQKPFIKLITLIFTFYIQQLWITTLTLTHLLENFELVLSKAASEDNNLGLKICVHYAMLKFELFRHWEPTEDLEEAIEKGKCAVIETQEEDIAYAERLNNLRVMLSQRYKYIEKTEDLEEAVRVAQQVVNITPEDHPNLADKLYNLGNELESRYECIGKMEDLKKAI